MEPQVVTLVIGNKNYSSWSLRPWLALRMAGVPFIERLEPFVAHGSHDAYRSFSPTGRVPCLIDGDVTVWDSLAITEYAAERHAGIWPADPVARAFARSAAAEKHSGFSALRNTCGMNCGVRVTLASRPAALDADLARIDELWRTGLDRFGGPFLAGSSFTAVDAFFAPVAFRLQTYGLSLGPAADAYAARLRDLGPMREWYAAGLAETWREPDHEADLRAAGTITEDLRATA
jgi:glutathione S-transferase